MPAVLDVSERKMAADLTSRSPGWFVVWGTYWRCWSAYARFSKQSLVVHESDVATLRERMREAERAAVRAGGDEAGRGGAVGGRAVRSLVRPGGGDTPGSVAQKSCMAACGCTAVDEDKVMARQKLHPADRLFLRVVLLTLGVAGLPVAMLVLGWIAGKFAGSLW